MDPGGVGALIGISVMLCGIITMKVHDVCQKKQTKVITSKTPLFVITKKPLLVRRQSKMNMVLPK